MKFLHLSDLHFTSGTAGTVFDNDIKIREALLEDLGVEGRNNFAGILVTGDVAYHGRMEEFERANAWLEDVRKKTGCLPEAIFVVPGNHDVNRKTVEPGSSLWDLHQMLREEMPTAARWLSLDQKLRDPWDFLSAQKEYAAFAKLHDCPTTATDPAWTYVLDEELEDGSRVRLHGLNSAILCDDSDAKANLLLGGCQFHHFDNRPEFVNVVLCHHPCTWLLDGNEADDRFRNQSHLVLSGHEHDARCYPVGRSLRVMAGAVHPNQREQHWEPTYHTVELSIREPQRALVIRVTSRVWFRKEFRFGPVAEVDGKPYHEQEIQLAAWTRPSAKLAPESGSLTAEPAASPVNLPTPSHLGPDAFASARRRLIVHFFRLGTIARYEAVIAAGVWEENYDTLEGQAKWARVFERAEKEQKFPALWEAVARNDETLESQANPFTPTP